MTPFFDRVVSARLVIALHLARMRQLHLMMNVLWKTRDISEFELKNKTLEIAKPISISLAVLLTTRRLTRDG